MENLQLYKRQIKEIQVLIEKLEKGNLKLSELSDLERLTRELHEKSIILRYKAFEKETALNIDSKAVTPVDNGDLEIKLQADDNEELSIDFSLFAGSGKSDESIRSEAPIHDVAQEVEEHVSITVTEDDEVIEKKSTTTRTEGVSFLERFNLENNAIGSNYAGAKISTLVGAFGLNQKLLFINELFNGSSELFSDAIKILDAQTNFDEASPKLNELAFENSWDVEDEAVIEFMEFLNRRYA